MELSELPDSSALASLTHCEAFGNQIKHISTDIFPKQVEKIDLATIVSIRLTEISRTVMSLT